MEIFEENFDYCNNSIMLDDQMIEDDYDDSVDENEGYENFRWSLNCIHLKDEIGVFSYYINSDKFEKPILTLSMN